MLLGQVTSVDQAVDPVLNGRNTETELRGDLFIGHPFVDTDENTDCFPNIKKISSVWDGKEPRPIRTAIALFTFVK